MNKNIIIAIGTTSIIVVGGIIWIIVSLLSNVWTRERKDSVRNRLREDIQNDEDLDCIIKFITKRKSWRQYNNLSYDQISRLFTYAIAHCKVHNINSRKFRNIMGSIKMK